MRVHAAQKGENDDMNAALGDFIDPNSPSRRAGFTLSEIKFGNPAPSRGDDSAVKRTATDKNHHRSGGY
jgi:hypothetical protein